MIGGLLTLILPPRRRTAAGAGITLVVSGYALFSASDTAVKWVSGTVPLAEIMVLTALFALAPVLTVALVTGGRAALATRRPGVHALRGLLSVSGTYGGYYALGHMPLADFYAGVFTAPLFITALSAPLLGERVDLPRWLAVVAGFSGVLIMARPGAGLIGPGALGALACAFFYALSVLLIRHTGGTERAVTFCVYGYAATLAVSAIALAATGSAVVPSWVDLRTLALAGGFSGCAMLCVVQAFRRVPPAVLAPFHYTQMIWGVLIGLFVFGEWPESVLATGGALVIGSGLFILYRETRPAPPT